MNIPAVNIAAKESSAAANQAGVGLLKKAFQILDLFTDERPIWTQSDLARETGLARSTLSRLVRFMCARGYLLEQRGRYTLGFAAIDLGRRAQSQFNLVDLSYDLLEEVALSTSETVILTGYDEAAACVICLAQIPSRRGGLRVFENIGTAFPLHCGATSKAVLAFLPARIIDNVLAGDLSPVNVAAARSTPAKLRKQLADIRARGFTVTREETYPGVIGAAVPVLTPRGQPLGSVGIAAPLQRMNADALNKGTQILIDVGRRLASRIAGAPEEQ